MKKFFFVVAFGCSLALSGCGYNTMVRLRQEVNQTWADVQSVYQRRLDLIPNLVKTVEGSANFEKGTLIEVTKARQQVNNIQMASGAAPTDPAAMQQFQAAQGQLGGALSRLLVTVEQYPDIKSTQNFLELQAQLEGTENRISVERRKFNEAVKNYNTTIASVPEVLYARFCGFTPHEFFQADSEAAKAPTVNFGDGK